MAQLGEAPREGQVNVDLISRSLSVGQVAAEVVPCVGKKLQAVPYLSQ